MAFPAYECKGKFFGAFFPAFLPFQTQTANETFAEFSVGAYDQAGVLSQKNRLLPKK